MQLRGLTAPIYEDSSDFVLEKVTLKDKKVSEKDLFGANEERKKKLKINQKKKKSSKKKA